MKVNPAEVRYNHWPHSEGKTMRRFEFQEGTSRKFWTVSQEGASLTVAWGRIGTAGQTQTKTFDTVEKASLELGKLVAEKTRKGYKEAPAPEEASAPEVPSPAEPVARPEVPAPEVPAEAGPVPGNRPPAARIQWTKAARENLLPRRGGLYLPSRKTDSFAEFKENVENYDKKILGMLERGIRKASPEIAPLQRLVWEGLRDPAGPRLPSPLDADSLAMLFAVLGRNEATIGYASQAAGFALTLEALLRSWTLDGKSDSRFEKEFWIERRPLRLGLGDRPWEPMRRAAAEAPGDEFERARQIAREARREASFELRCLLSYVFPEEPSWVEEDSREFFSQSPSPLFGWSLLASVSDISLASKFFEHAQKPGQWGLTQTAYLWPYRYVLLETLGAQAVPLLASLFSPKSTSGMKQDMVNVIGLVKNEEAARVLAPFATDKSTRKYVVSYFEDFPSLAFEVLAPFARSSKKEDELTGLIRRLARSFPEELKRALPKVDQGTRRYLESLAAELETSADRAAARPTALPEELPEILVNPPWLRTDSAEAAIPVLALAIPPDPAGVELEPEDEDLKPFFMTKPPQTARKDEENLRRVEDSAKKNEGGQPGVSWMDTLSDEAALVQWNTRPAGFWYLGSYSLIPLVLRFGHRALPGLLAMMKREPGRALEALSRIAAPPVAPAMADALIRLKKSRAIAEEWLTKHAQIAAIGLIPGAFGPAGPARTASRTALRFLSERGEGDALASAATLHGTEASRALDLLLSNGSGLMGSLPPPALPSFAEPAALPGVALKSGKILSPEALRTLLGFLQLSTPASAHPGVAAVKAACDSHSLEQFGWSLFQAWLGAGAPSKEDWAFLAAGILGGDDSARKLAPLIRAWPGESAHARAVLGLDVLGLIGTDLALMLLNGMAEKLKFKALQDRAKEKIDRIAKSRGLTAEELADRLVPDLGLDPDGSRTLDFGPRQFRAGFDELLRPFVLDSAGHRLPELPKPGKTDDAALSTEAVDVWKALKRDARALSGIQIARLERLLSSRRRFPFSTFRPFFVEHPLVFHLARRLVFGVYGESGQLETTFRIAEDRSFATVEDAPLEMAVRSQIGLPHPLELDAALISSWMKLLADYEIIQPFPQLARPVFVLRREERNWDVLSIGARRASCGSVLSLELRGWRRGYVESGCLLELVKPLPGSGDALLELAPGVPLMAGAQREVQEIRRVGLTHGMTLKDVDPVVYSELVYDIETLTE